MTKREYFVVYQEDLVECYERATNDTIPHPKFDRARFVGKAEIEHNIVDHWVERSPEGRDHLQIFNRVDNGYVVRTDFDDGRRGHAITFEFHEWNAAPQDPSLFVLPQVILSICTTV